MRYSQSNVKRYRHLAVGTAVMLVLGLIYAWSIYREPLSQVFPTWSISDMSMTFTLSMIFFCGGCILSGRLTKILKYSQILLIAAALLSTGFFFASRLNGQRPEQSLIQLYIFYGAFCGLGVGMGYVTVISVIAKWFPDKMGLATGVLLMSYGFGGLIFGGVINTLISKVGLFNTFFILAIFVALILTTGSLLLKPPKSLSSSSSIKAQSGSKEIPPRQMVKTPEFWLFLSWNFTICAAGLLVINSAAPIAAAFGAPAVLGLLVLICNGLGRIAFGIAADKLNRRRAMFINCVLLLSAGVCLYAGAVLNSVILIFAGLLLIGLSYGGAPALITVVIRLLFGDKHYSENFGVSTLQVIPAAIIGPLVSSLLIERSQGAYNSTFAMIIGFAVFALVLNALLNKVSE